MPRMRTVVRGVVVVLGLVGAGLGGALAPPEHNLGPHPSGIAAPTAPKAGHAPEGVEQDHGHDEFRSGPPLEFPGRHVASATGVNVVPTVRGDREGQASGNVTALRTDGAGLVLLVTAAAALLALWPRIRIRASRAA